MKRISIIIPTYNRKESLRETLAALGRQSFCPDDFEVLVVDDGGTDGTDMMVRDMPVPYRLSYYRVPHGGPGSARNEGSRMAGGDLLLFIDDDIQASPELVAEHVRMHEEQEGIMVLGSVVPLPGTGMLYLVLHDANYRGILDGHPLEFNAISANLSLSRWHFEACGGFNCELQRCEDLEFGFRAFTRLGLRLVYHPEAIGYHNKSVTTAEAARIQFQAGKYLVKALLLHPAILSQKRSRVLSGEIRGHLSRTKGFRPLTAAGCLKLTRKIDRFEKALMRQKSRAVEVKLESAYREMINYCYDEGLYAARNKFSQDHSLFECAVSPPDPEQCLIGMPLRLVSTIDSMSGHGSHAVNLLRELSRRGFMIIHDPVGNPPPRGGGRWIRTCPAPDRLRPLAVIFLGSPDIFAKDRRYHTIGYTAFETTEIPPQWTERCNSMDELWVVSTFNRDSFRRCGVTVPIFVMPHGLEPSTFKPSLEKPPLDLPGYFVFLNVGCCHHYKGLDLLLQAYFEEFSGSERVCLILKTYSYFGPHQNRIHECVSEMRRQIHRDDPPWLIVLDRVYIESMASLYNLADAYVSTSRGEGFGLPLLEAMACGRPVISNDFGGPADFLTRENAFLLKYTMADVCSNDHPWHTGGQWAETSVPHLRRTMRYVYEHSGEREKRGMQARRDFLKNWTLSGAGEKMSRRLHEIYGKGGPHR